MSVRPPHYRTDSYWSHSDHINTFSLLPDQELVPQEDIHNVLHSSTMKCMSCVYALQGYFPYVYLTWLICFSLITNLKETIHLRMKPVVLPA